MRIDDHGLAKRYVASWGLMALGYTALGVAQAGARRDGAFIAVAPALVGALGVRQVSRSLVDQDEEPARDVYIAWLSLLMGTGLASATRALRIPIRWIAGTVAAWSVVTMLAVLLLRDAP